MYPDIDWANEPDVEALRSAYGLLTVSFDLAVERLEGLANRGSIASLWYLGDAFATNRFGRKHLEKAVVWLERGEARGWIAASYMLGRTFYEKGAYTEAMKSFARGATKGHIPAVYRLGKMHAMGTGTSRDYVEAERLLRVASSFGHLFAKRDQGTLYLQGKLGILKIPVGILILFSLFFDLGRMIVRTEWKMEGFEDRILA